LHFVQSIYGVPTQPVSCRGTCFKFDVVKGRIFTLFFRGRPARHWLVGYLAGDERRQCRAPTFRVSVTPCVKFRFRYRRQNGSSCEKSQLLFAPKKILAIAGKGL